MSLSGFRVRGAQLLRCLNGRAAAPGGGHGLASSDRKTLAAFARALLPGGCGLPGAQRDGGVEVVEPVCQLLDEAPHRARLLVRLTLRLIEWGQFPKRFSGLPADRAAAHLSSLASSRLAIRREMLFALKTLVCVVYAGNDRVRASTGTLTTCVVEHRATAQGDAGLEPLAPALKREQLGLARGLLHCDVVVVGSGAGGASAARVLAERGLSVIVLERGPFRDASDYSTEPVVALTSLYREAGLTFCEGPPAIALPIGRCVGGTTVINSGTCMRAPADVLGGWRQGHGIDWAASLDADFEAAERAIGVSRVESQHCGRHAELCRAGSDVRGWSNGALRRNAPGVTCCSSCPTGCAVDAKLAMHVSELPRAVAAGARVCAETAVERVLVEGGRAVGVAGRGYEVRARAVVLAAGALGTPELLLRQGIANSSSAVGRNLRVHPVCWVGASFERPVRGWEGVMQSWSVNEFAKRRLFLEATATPLAFGAHLLDGVGAELQERIAGYEHFTSIGVHLGERSSGSVTLDRRAQLRVRHRLNRDDVRAMLFGIARAAEIHTSAGAREIYPQIERLSPLPPGQLHRIERARPSSRSLRLQAFHPMGTARMGADPHTSVVCPTGQTHDLPGLYVADASIFPTSLGANPMLTIMACARHVAGQLASRLS